MILPAYFCIKTSLQAESLAKNPEIHLTNTVFHLSPVLITTVSVCLNLFYLSLCKQSFMRTRIMFVWLPSSYP